MMITNSVQFFKDKNYNIKKNNCQLIIVAWKLKTPGNIGNFIRLAHNAGATKVLFINDGKTKRMSEVRRTAGFSYNQMEWEIIEEYELFNRIPPDFQTVVVETSNGSQNIYNTTLPPKTVFLFGSESYGIPKEIIQKCTTAIHIPVPGGCKSLNVSHSAAVAVFEWYRQMYFSV